MHVYMYICVCVCVYIHTHITIKNNEIMPFAATWMDIGASPVAQQ